MKGVTCHLNHGVLWVVTPRAPNLGGGDAERPPTKIAKPEIPPPTVSEPTTPWRNMCDSTLIIIGEIYDLDIRYQLN